MAKNDGAALAAWLERMQGVRLDPARIGEPAATARRLSALADAADSALPPGAEPSGFTLAQERLSESGKAAGGAT